MTIPRDKIVGLSVAAIAVLGLLYAITNAFLLNPIQDRNRQELALREKIDELAATKNNLKNSPARYARLRDQTYADTPLDAGVRIGRRVNELAKRAGLGQAQYTTRTFTGPGGKGFSIVGCNVTGKQVALDRLTNFLYLLTRDRHLHRVSNLEITPQKNNKIFNFTLRYVTPVFDPKTPSTQDVEAKKGVKAAKGVKVRDRKPMTSDQLEIASLNTPDREAYNVVHERNIFRPYVAPRRTPPRRTPPTRTPPPVRPPPVPSYDRLVVTGLPGVGDHHEVHLTRPGGEKAAVHKVGEKIPVGTIAMVDYRELLVPAGEKKKRPSSGRVILKIGRDYWAVERGQPLGTRRLLKKSELPEKLRPVPATQPAAKR